MSSKRWSDSKFGGFLHNKKQKDQIVLTGREQEEKMESILWINHTLANAGYSTHAVNDITKDLCDGIVLGILLQSITGEVIRHYSSPMTTRQKVENIQAILSVVNQRGVSTAGINPEDVVRGNLKTILTLCREIRHGIFVKDNSTYYSYEMVSPAARKDSLLVWAGDVLDCEVADYSEFRNGQYLCDLINIIHNNGTGATAGSNILLTNGSPQKCLTNAVHAAEKYFGITIDPFDVMQVVKGENDAAIQLFLQQLRDVKSRKSNIALKRSNRVLSNDSINVGNGLGKKDSPWFTGCDENRGDEYRRQHSTPPGAIHDLNHNQMMSNSQVFDHQGDERGNTPQNNRLRVSHSTDHLQASSSNQPFYGSDVNGRTSRRPRHRPTSVDDAVSTFELSQNRGMPYRQQTDSMPANRYSQLNHSNPNIGPQPYSLSKQTDRGGTNINTERSQYRYSLPNSTNTTVEYSYSNDLPMPVTIYRTSSRNSIHSTSSRSSMERNSTDEQHLSSTYLTNPQSAIPFHTVPPEYQTEKHLRVRSNSSGGVPPPSSSGSASMDHLLHSVDDLNYRIVELSELMLEERNVLIQKMIGAVNRERKKRQELEKKYNNHIMEAKGTVQRYDSCLVHLGKEVSKLSNELIEVKEQLSTFGSFDNDIRTMNTELRTLSQKVDELVQHGLQHQQRESADLSHQNKIVSSGTGAADKGKKNIFSRKKS